MDLCRLPVLLAVPALLSAAHPVSRSLGELNYRMKVQFRWDSVPVEGRFRLVPTPVLVAHNRVQKPRLGGWRLEIVKPREGADLSEALARMDRMLYLSGPAPGMRPLNAYAGLAGHRSPLWQVDTPKDLQVYAYLAEVHPGLLALSYLSGSFEHGDLVKIEVQLESSSLGPGVRPAENGMALLGALQRLAEAGGQGKDHLDDAIERVLPE